uniref:Uncharacterized protein n=1 Tax=Glossina austeni TaxID=7395 RepID=A0A1A9V8L4_GLOAU
MEAYTRTPQYYALLRAEGTAERILPNEWAEAIFAATAKTVNIIKSFMTMLRLAFNSIQYSSREKLKQNHRHTKENKDLVTHLDNPIGRFRGKRCAQIPNKTGASQVFAARYSQFRNTSSKSYLLAIFATHYEYFGFLIFTPVAAKAELTATKTIISTTMQGFMALTS